MIRLYNDYQGIINGYSPFIVRPIDTVHVPGDISRGSFIGDSCNWPCYADSNYQQWCSEENATKYQAMRPLITNEKYEQNLHKLFKAIVDPWISKGFYRPDNMTVTPVFCSNSKEALKIFLSLIIAEGVKKVPELQRNGSWAIEQFYITDPDVYQFIDPIGFMYYNIVFNLYNPLRSASTIVETTLIINNSYNPKYPVSMDNLQFIPVYLNFVNTMKDKSGIKGYNDLESEIDSSGGPASMNVDWNYGNTLLKQEFNTFGFFEPDKNIKIHSTLPHSLRRKIKDFQEQSDSYLLGCAGPKYNGVTMDFDPNSKKLSYNASLNNGTQQNVMANQNLIYDVPLVLNKNETLSRQSVPFSRPTKVIS